MKLGYWHKTTLTESCPEQTGVWQLMPGHSVSEPVRPSIPQLQVQTFLSRAGLVASVSAVPYFTALQVRASSQGQPRGKINHAEVLIWHQNSQDHLL